MKCWPVLLGLMVACGDNADPCSVCPPLAGTWVFQFDTASSNGCDQTSFGALPVSVLIGQQESVLNATLNGVALSGSLFDSYDFTLNGSNLSPDGGAAFIVQLQGVYIPSETGDAGADQIQEGVFSRSQDLCQEATPFTASRP